MSTILYNGHIYQNRGVFTQALLIQDGLIQACGSNEQILVHRLEDTQVIDLGGRTVLPGFNDSHLHLYMSALAAKSVDLYGLTSIEAIVERATQFMQSHPESSLNGLSGRGWNQDYFTDEQRLLNRHDLDRISTDIPIVFGRACGHVVAANTKALELTGLFESIPIIEGGQVDIDESGIVTGIIRENAIGLLESLKHQPSLDEMVSTLREIGAIANRFGITSVQTNDLTIGHAEAERLEEAYARFAQDNPTLRVYHQSCFKDLETFEQRISEGYQRHANAFNRMGPLKLFVDGSLGARTAYMRQPYADDPSTQGILCMSPDLLNAFVQTADQAGIQIAIHAIGDGAMSQVLDSYQTVIRDRNPLRHGIIHCQITDMEILNRFAQMDVLAYVQPIFLHYDMHIAESRVGASLASTSYAFKTMEDLGLNIAYGTDSPVEGLNVFNNIHCAINRQDLTSFPEGGYYPNEKVDLETAIDRLSIGGAYASFEETTKGRLLPGYVADLVVVSQPIFEMDPSKIKDVQVEMTIIDGRMVYSRENKQ